MGRPSRMLSRRSSKASSAGAVNLHLLGQPKESALGGLARGFGGRFAQRVGEVGIAHAELHSSDDRLALFRSQSRQSLLVGLDCLASDRLFERRFAAKGHDVVEPGLVWAP